MAPLQRAIVALAVRLRREEGQALVEYALILGLISVVTITLLGLIGGDVSSLLSKVESGLKSAV
jgi:pilus assembly protein Flp/PilA